MCSVDSNTNANGLHLLLITLCIFADGGWRMAFLFTPSYTYRKHKNIPYHGNQFPVCRVKTQIMYSTPSYIAACVAFILITFCSRVVFLFIVLPYLCCILVAFIFFSFFC
jgi:hypothetical protein